MSANPIVPMSILENVARVQSKAPHRRRGLLAPQNIEIVASSCSPVDLLC